MPNWPKTKSENPLQIIFYMDMIYCWYSTKSVSVINLLKSWKEKRFTVPQRGLHTYGARTVSTTARIPCTKTFFFKWSWGEIGGVFYVTLQNLKQLEDIKWNIIISENTAVLVYSMKMPDWLKFMVALICLCEGHGQETRKEVFLHSYRFRDIKFDMFIY